MKYFFRNTWWNKRKRPKIKTAFTVFDLIIEIIGLVALLALWILLLVSYFDLPDVIPVHFDGLGQANAFGGKRSILFLPVIATVLYAVMTIVNWFPHVFNFPVVITEENAFFQYSNMSRMLRCLKLSLILIFGSIVFQTIRNAEGHTEGLGIWFLPFVLAITIIPILFFTVKSFIYR